MSTQSAPFYWLTCDVCGVKSTDGSDQVAWQEPWMAEHEAANSGWWLEGGNHVCWDCIPSEPDEPTEFEAALLGSPEVMDKIKASLADPTRRQPRPGPRKEHKL
jgi:hypothetical protein